MNNFKKPARRFGGSAGSFRGPSRGPSRGFSEDREKFSATCNKCQMSCEVPFRPNGKKPFYCRNCFVRDDAQSAPYQKREYGARPSFDRTSSFDRASSFNRPPAEDVRLAAIAKELSAVHAKLDDLIERLEA